MKHRLLFVLLFVCVTHSEYVAHAESLGRYYNQMVDGGKSAFPGIYGKATVQLSDSDELSIFLVVGDVFDFIGRDGDIKCSVDAMLISTNVLLNFQSGNPTIQASLRKRLPTVVSQRIDRSFYDVRRLFKKKHPRDDFVFPVLKECVAVSTILNFSPARFHFVATDKLEGGTNTDPVWQALRLSRENIGAGVKAGLDSAVAENPKCGTFVTPLIGSSKVELQKKYISDRLTRRELIDRAGKSVAGIMEGIVQHTVSAKRSAKTVSEIAIIIWDQDILKIVDPPLLKARQVDKDDLPGGYLDYQRRIEREFDFGVRSLHHELRLSRE